MRYWLLLASIAFFATPSHADSPFELVAFQSTYKVFRNGSEVGTGKRTFHHSADGRWYFCSESSLNWFILSDKRKEQSWVKLTDGKVNSVEYQFNRSGTGPDRESHIIFDGSKKSLTDIYDDYPLATEWAADLLDPVGYQLQMRLDVAAGKSQLLYPVLYKGERREYRYEVVGDEVIELPIGQVEAVKLKRVRKNNRRETFVWLSKQHDYIFARIWQSKDGDEQADLRLAEFELLNDGGQEAPSEPQAQAKS
ncbi:DUF3108 domain-containing protein [Neiella sp. HB171785]|uniref:DUF3108 domain-containing protein n=1 Tax=Neiella litorisoli TaxID=2771431 RepID=A0A8J6UJV2_9GAMM|nr:DUF3108 domain-containing protein [Neiella litorisoli]MBD1391188.1 DUF3108 domain-containing protein [Neiella litorisoli]